MAFRPVADDPFYTFRREGVPGEQRFILRFEDAEVHDMYFDNEKDAIEKYELHDSSWNMTLYATYPRKENDN